MTIPPPPPGPPGTPPPPPPGPPPSYDGGYDPQGQNFSSPSAGYSPPPGPSSQQGASNGAATTALVLGILSFLCAILLSIPAIIFGFIGRGKAKQLGGVGSGQATTGIVLGFVTLILGIIGFVALVVFGAVFGEEIENSTSRFGETAKASDYEITNPEVKISEFGMVEFVGDFTNNTTFNTSYTIDFSCTSNSGETYSGTTSVSAVGEGERTSFIGYPAFVDDPTSVDCEVTEVQYSFW